MSEIFQQRVRIVKEESDAEFIADSGFKMAFETENKKLDKATVLEGVKNVIRTPKYGEYYVAEIKIDNE